MTSLPASGIVAGMIIARSLGDRQQKRIRSSFLVLLTCLLLAACSLPQTLPQGFTFFGPSPTPPASSTPTPTLTPTATPTPLPTPTPVPAARVQTGDEALFVGDWDTALEEYRSALQDSQDPEVKSAALLGIGRTLSLKDDQAGAVDSLVQLIQVDPDSPQAAEAYFHLGQIYTQLERYNEAAEAYQNYLNRRPGVIDAYVLEWRGDALLASNNYGEAINNFRAALQSPSLLDNLRLEIKIANTHAIAGDYETALAMYTDLYNRTDSDFIKAEMDLRMGQMYNALNRPQEAYTAFQDAVNNYPTSYDSYQALLALVDAGVPVDELNRGIVDYYAGQYSVATQAFDRYLSSAPPDPAAAHYYYGLALRQLGGYSSALEHWDTIIQNNPDHRFWDDAWEQKAYTQWAYQDQYNPAINTLLDFVGAAENHPRAGEFLFDAAQVAERDGQLARAAGMWDQVQIKYPSYEKASRALFLAGISRYRLKDYPAALQTFGVYLAQATSLDQRAAAALWRGKTQAAMGDQAAARADWEQAANIDPTGYYSERARDLLRERVPFTPPTAFDFSRDLLSERREAEDWLRLTFSLDGSVDLSSPGLLAQDGRFQRGTELWKLGLYDEARVEFEDLRQSISTDAAASYRLANYLVDIGMYRSAILAARQVLDLAGMDDAATMNAPIYFNHLRFGTYYSDLILSEAEAHGFNPLFFFSLVRQESAFEGFVRSSAGARGLMQIVPATGQEIVDSLSWPAGYTPEDLYRPIVSLKLGATYLDKWRDHFKGDLYTALAAYNSGPGNAASWKELSGDDPDLFLEIIRFEETRNYIRGISEIFSIYRRLYDRSP